MNLIDLKVILIGDSNAGKSSLISRFVHNSFSQNGERILKDVVYPGLVKDVVYPGARVRFTLLEVNEPSAVRLPNCPAVYLLCFSLADPRSLLSAVGVWYPRVRDTGTPLILVGCKSDMCKVEVEQIRAMSSEVQAADYIETSAKVFPITVSSVFDAAYALTSNQSPISPLYKRRSRSAVRESTARRTPYLRNSMHRSPVNSSSAGRGRDTSQAGRGRDSSILSTRSKTGSLSSVSVKSKSSTLSSTKSDSSMISISTKTPRIRRRGETKEAEKGERMVTIRCERLSSEREYEQVEIEIPLSVYNNMQPQNHLLSNRNSANRKSLINKLKNLFI